MKLLMILAIAPGFLLLRYVYKQDKIEKEPTSLLVKLVLFGALTTISAIILETVGDGFVTLFLEENTTLYNLIDNFLVIALAEEWGKYVVLKKFTWKHPAFNFRFDAIVYAVCVGVGFAILENILYVIDGGFSVAILRALTAVPSHTIFAIAMGYYYGQAKYEFTLAESARSKRNLKKCLWIPVALHGFYDFSLSEDSWIMSTVFLGFVIVMDVVAINKLKSYSKQDIPIDFESAG